MHIDWIFGLLSGLLIGLGGSVFLGAGWALVGICKRPAIARLGFDGTNVILFFVSMIIGILPSKSLRPGPVSTADG
tara:strand:- start:142 stop:369 length:228 start_codon:yes stop_codon:yes gene_type:complete